MDEDVIGWQLERSDELVLKELVIFKVVIEAKRGPKHEQERSQVCKVDEGSCIWVKLCPDLTEAFSLGIVKEPRVFALHLLESVNNQGNK